MSALIVLEPKTTTNVPRETFAKWVETTVSIRGVDVYETVSMICR